MEWIKIGDAVRFYGYPGLDGRGIVERFDKTEFFAYVRTHWVVSGDEFTARVAVMNMKKDG